MKVHEIQDHLHQTLDAEATPSQISSLTDEVMGQSQGVANLAIGAALPIVLLDSRVSNIR